MTAADLSRQAFWQRGHMTVGLVTRALIQAWEEAHELREMLA